MKQIRVEPVFPRPRSPHPEPRAPGTLPRGAVVYLGADDVYIDETRGRYSPELGDRALTDIECVSGGQVRVYWRGQVRDAPAFVVSQMKSYAATRRESCT